MKRLILRVVLGGVVAVALVFLSLDNAAAESAKELLDKGAGYVDRGNYDEAISCFTESIALDPAYAKAYCNRGIVYNQKGNYAQAIADCDKAVKLDPKLSAGHHCLGNAYYKLGKYDQAIDDYTRAIEIDPGYSAAYVDRAIAYFNQKEFAKSWQDVYKAEALGGKVPPDFPLKGPVGYPQNTVIIKKPKIIDPFSEEYKKSLTKDNSTESNSTQMQANATIAHLEELLEKQKAETKGSGQNNLTSQDNITAGDFKVFKSK